MKRATRKDYEVYQFANISIHALMKRATSNKAKRKVTMRNFNPRPHEEGDWSALRLLFSLVYFNPRPHEEGDRVYQN